MIWKGLEKDYFNHPDVIADEAKAVAACAAAADTDGRSSAADSDEVTELRKQLSLAKVALAEASFDAEETACKERRASRDAADKERKLKAQEEERRKRLEQARLGAFGGRR